MATGQIERQVMAGTARMSSWMLVATTIGQVALVVLPGIRRIQNGTGGSRLVGVGFVALGVSLCGLWLFVLVRRFQSRRKAAVTDDGDDHFG